MCKALQDMRDEAREAGRLEGKIEGELNSLARIARKLLRKGSSIEEAAEFLEITVDDVRVLIERDAADV